MLSADGLPDSEDNVVVDAPPVVDSPPVIDTPPVDENGDAIVPINTFAINPAAAAVPDIQMREVTTTDGKLGLSVKYDILNGAVGAFEIGFYRSADNHFGGDTLLSAATINAAADLSVGSHTKTFTIGSGAGQIKFPGVGAAENSKDYFILAVADHLKAVAEDDADPFNEDNTAAFFGLYHAAAGEVFVHGTQFDDTGKVTTAGANLHATANAEAFDYALTDVKELRIRVHDGADNVDGTTVDKPMFILGGPGRDKLRGGAAADTIQGGSSDDELRGGKGNDTLGGQTGNDLIRGGAGADTWLFVGSDANDILTARLDTARHQLVVNRRSTANGPVLDSDRCTGIQSLVLRGEKGDDQITVSNRIAISGTIDGGPGTDTAHAPSKFGKKNVEH